jgi:hypothetical protein
VNWISLAQNRDEWQALVNRVMNITVLCDVKACNLVELCIPEDSKLTRLLTFGFIQGTAFLGYLSDY